MSGSNGGDEAPKCRFAGSMVDEIGAARAYQIADIDPTTFVHRETLTFSFVSENVTHGLADLDIPWFRASASALDPWSPTSGSPTSSAWAVARHDSSADDGALAVPGHGEASSSHGDAVGRAKISLSSWNVDETGGEEVRSVVKGYNDQGGTRMRSARMDRREGQWAMVLESDE